MTFDHSTDPATAVRHLRATAAARGVTLSPVDPVDAAAAVITADAWMAATGALTLDGAGVDYDVLTAALLRAAGNPPPGPRERSYVPARLTDPERAEQWGRWCRAHLGESAGAEALRRAAGDVGRATHTPDLAGCAELLRDVADFIADL